MYTLYIANKNYSSWSLRPWVLMRALAIPFEERLVWFKEGSNWTSFRSFSPNGRVPCLHDDGLVIWDSLAIVEYLAERHGDVWPASERTRAWARSVVAEMHSGFAELRGRCPMNCGLRAKLKAGSESLRADLARIEEIWTEGIGRFGGPFLAGPRFGAVDAFFAPVAFRAQTFALPFGDVARDYVQLMLNHDAMQDWYRAALSEPRCETSQESEVAATSVVLADFRTAAADLTTSA